MKKYLKILIASILGALLLSACSPSSVNSNLISDNESLIKEITSSYLTEINSGAFAAEMYNSKFTPSLVIKELSFAQPQAQSLMNESMAYMTFEIYGVKQVNSALDDLFDKRAKANCLVEVSVIDIEDSLKKIDNPFLGYADILKLLPLSHNMSIIKKNIVLKLAYNEEHSKWEIIDNHELTQLIIEPFKRLELDNPAGRPDTIISEYIQSLRSMDIDKIIDLEDGSGKDTSNSAFELEMFFDRNKINLEDAKKIFPYVKIEVIPDFSILPDDSMYYSPYSFKVPIRVSFPNIGDSLKNLDHKASIEEIVSLLKKSDNGNMLVFEEQVLELWSETDTKAWRVEGTYDNFKSIVQEVWLSIYSYPYLPDPSETSDQYMNYLVTGELSKINSLSMSTFPSWYMGSEFKLKDSGTYSNSQFVKELLSDCDYKLTSIEKDLEDQQMYVAKYSVSLPDLQLLLKRITADQEALVPMLKPALEKYLADQANSNDQNRFEEKPATLEETNFFHSYIEYVKNLTKNEEIPLKEYQIEISVKPFTDMEKSSWYVYDFSLIEPDAANRFTDFFRGTNFFNITHEAKKQILAEGVYTRAEFASLAVRENWFNLY